MIICSCAFGRVSSFSSSLLSGLKRDITADLRRHIDDFLAGVAARFRAIGAPVPLISGASGNPDREHPLLRFELLGHHLRGDKRTRQSAYARELAPRPSAAWAAANRAIGTRNGEQDT
jgi:hypothetical protein